ncbi:MAG TPA: hypothetical protein IAA30_08745 [Candidatus Treponema faecavium]|nr:hypothetical protein [Candidatus Treponema faecavium]
MFDFGGFSISNVLFSSVFPDMDSTQAILMKGRRKRDGMEKLIFAIIEKGEGRSFKILDNVIFPVPKDCPDAARIAEVMIGNKLTTATLRILVDTAEISVTLENRDIEYYKETYIFTPAPNMLELPID